VFVTESVSVETCATEVVETVKMLSGTGKAVACT
jgi:hypothetical protein